MRRRNAARRPKQDNSAEDIRIEWAIMWADLQDERLTTTQRLTSTRECIQHSDHLLVETRRILLSSTNAIQSSRDRIRESDRLLSQYVSLPDHWMH